MKVLAWSLAVSGLLLSAVWLWAGEQLLVAPTLLVSLLGLMAEDMLDREEGDLE